MKIAYYIWETFTSGGLMRITIDKMNYLVDRGYELVLITERQQGKKSFWDLDTRIRQYDLGIDYTSANRIANPIKRWWALRRLRDLHLQSLESILREEQVDVCVNTIFCREGELFPRLRDGSKKVLESHGVKYALLPQYERKGKLAFIQRWFDKQRRLRYERLPSLYDRFVVLSSGHIAQWGGG